MGTSVLELLNRVRAMIPEADPIEWTNARLLVHLNLELKAWGAELGQLPGPGWFTTEADFTLPANATTYDLTEAIDATAGAFAAVKTLWYLPRDGGDAPEIDSVSPGHEQRFRLSPNQSPVGQTPPLGRWLSRPGGVPTLNLHPESNVDRDFRLYLRYDHPTVDENDSVETDPRHDDVLVRGTTLRALEEASEDDPLVRGKYESDKVKFLAIERNAAGEFCSETTKPVVSEAYFGGG